MLNMNKFEQRCEKSKEARLELYGNCFSKKVSSEENMAGMKMRLEREGK
jgi:hypothetical protein